MFLIIVLSLLATKGVHRWINLGLSGFQPSKTAKLVTTSCFTHLILINFRRMDMIRHGVFPYVLLLAVTVPLPIREPHVSATAIIIALAGIMPLIGDVPLRWLGVVFGIALAGIAYLVLFTSELSYANDRVTAWSDPSTTERNLLADTW